MQSGRMNRRKFLAFLAAGGVVTATGLWMPGQKLISIPKRAGGDFNRRYLGNGWWQYWWQYDPNSVASYCTKSEVARINVT